MGALSTQEMPRVGDKVRVTYEGLVTQVNQRGFDLDKWTHHYLKPEKYETTIEILARRVSEKASGSS